FAPESGLRGTLWEFTLSPSPARKLTAPPLGLPVMVPKAGEPLAQQRMLGVVSKRHTFNIIFAHGVGQRDAFCHRRVAHDGGRVLTLGNPVEILEEALAHHGDANIARAQILVAAVGDAALASPANDILVYDVTNDPLALVIAHRGHPGGNTVLHVGLA